MGRPVSLTRARAGCEVEGERGRDYVLEQHDDCGVPTLMAPSKTDSTALRKPSGPWHSWKGQAWQTSTS